MKKLCVFLAFLLLLSGCAEAPARVSDEELAALREQYPYNDELNPLVCLVDSMDNLYPDFETVIRNLNEPFNDPSNYTLAVIDLTGDRYSEGGLSRMKAKAVQILWGDGLQEEEECYLSFGWFDAGIGKVFQKGERLVCFLRATPSVGVFSASKTLTWYLTEHNIVLSVVSTKGLDETSGLYLDSFAQLVTDTMKQLAK